MTQILLTIRPEFHLQQQTSCALHSLRLSAFPHGIVCFKVLKVLIHTFYLLPLSLCMNTLVSVAEGGVAACIFGCHSGRTPAMSAPRHSLPD